MFKLRAKEISVTIISSRREQKWDQFFYFTWFTMTSLGPFSLCLFEVMPLSVFCYCIFKLLIGEVSQLASAYSVSLMKHRHLLSLVKKKSVFILMLFRDSHKSVARLDILTILLSSNKLTLPLVPGVFTRLSTEFGWLPFSVLRRSGVVGSIRNESGH